MPEIITPEELLEVIQNLPEDEILNDSEDSDDTGEEDV